MRETHAAVEHLAEAHPPEFEAVLEAAGGDREVALEAIFVAAATTQHPIGRRMRERAPASLGRPEAAASFTEGAFRGFTDLSLETRDATVEAAKAFLEQTQA